MKYKPYMNVANGLWALDKGAGMIELNLLDALVARLTELFRGYELQAKGGIMQNVKVIAQNLPKPSAVSVKTDDEDSDSDSEAIEPQGYTVTDIESIFPCVIVRRETVDKEEGSLDQSRTNVMFSVGVYDSREDARDCQGYRDVYNIIEVIRQDLLAMPMRVLDKRYRLEMPFTSGLIDDDVHPLYFGYINTYWETGRPMMPLNFRGRL